MKIKMNKNWKMGKLWDWVKSVIRLHLFNSCLPRVHSSLNTNPLVRRKNSSNNHKCDNKITESPQEIKVPRDWIGGGENRAMRKTAEAERDWGGSQSDKQRAHAARHEGEHYGMWSADLHLLLPYSKTQIESSQVVGLRRIHENSYLWTYRPTNQILFI